MRVVPGPRNGLRRRHANFLGERDPSLLNLPVPIPSPGPLLAPLITPLIAGTPPQSAAPPAESPGSSGEDSSSQGLASPTSTSPSPPPPLISLPFVLPSIPVLSPLLDPILAPLIGGAEPSSSSHAQGTPATTTAQQTPVPTATQDPSTPSSPGNSSGDQPGSGGSSGGDTPSNGGTPGSGGDTPSSGGSPGSGGGNSSSGSGTSSVAGSGGSDSVGNSSTSDGGNSPSDGGSSGGNGDAGELTPSGSSVGSPSTGVSGSIASDGSTGSSLADGLRGSNTAKAGHSPSVSSDQPTAAVGNSGGASSVVAGSVGGAGVPGSDSVLGGGSTMASFGPVENVHGGVALSTVSSSVVPSMTASYANGRPVPTDAPTSSVSSSGSNTSGPTSEGIPTASPSAHSSGGLSSGALAAIITIAVLLALGLLVCCLRKRAILKRKSSRKWWFGGPAKVYGSTAISASQYFRDHPSPPGSTSTRSSFATAFDQGSSMRQSPFSQAMPPLLQVPVQQTWLAHLSGSMSAPSTIPTVESGPSPIIRTPDRSSWRHSESSSSGGESRTSTPAAQYALAPDSVILLGPSSREFPPSPMSVRPFSPSETWAFPKPPGLTDVVRSDTLTLASARSQVGTSWGSSAVATASEDPFTNAVRTSSMYATAPEENPFSDPAATHSPSHSALSFLSSTDAETASHFATIETICRPFVPTMPDEMPTAPGERVRMLQRFSDGWAYAEKLETGSRGLIPIDCLRTSDQDLPAFLAAKRLSSYRGLNLSLHGSADNHGVVT